jgi:hypothetical protein
VGDRAGGFAADGVIWVWDVTLLVVWAHGRVKEAERQPNSLSEGAV